MPLPIIPGPNNELITGSAASLYSFSDPALNVLTLYAGNITASKPTTNTTTTVYAVDAWDGPVNISLPPSDGNAQFFFKKIDGSANPVRIYPHATNTIDGTSSQILSSQWNSVRLISYTTASWLKF
jgi:hypothetical protein